MLFYSVAGLIIASEIPLPGRDSLDGAAEAAAAIRLDRVPAHLSSPIKTGPNWSVNETELLLSVPSVASFLVVAGEEIRVQPAAGRDERDAAPFLTQILLGLLMQQRGRTVLRASVVAANGKALLFCGDSAAGKSTIAAAMATRGSLLLGDDFCTVDWRGDGTALVHGDGVLPMLWSDSIDALGLGNATETALRKGCHKYPVRSSARSAGGVPMGAICFLGEDRRVDTCRFVRRRGMTAVQAIRDNAYRAQAVATAEQRLRAFEAATRIARQTAIFSLARTSGFDWIDEGLSAVEAALPGAPEDEVSP